MANLNFKIAIRYTENSMDINYFNICIYIYISISIYLSIYTFFWIFYVINCIVDYNTIRSWGWYTLGTQRLCYLWAWFHVLYDETDSFVICRLLINVEAKNCRILMSESKNTTVIVLYRAKKNYLIDSRSYISI